ncbi:uncharacterized protein CLUP02_09012 [Colletotrichum lupini]|uniref:Uncharacterized protein n=1 Tax=Colletotrichum lupini TaxID=145971 RepID=A0A9Q8SU60_9PEZI|nr:uncharacterized protein CLUP02_09012 [Colletotrichum lupini]UQC83518.1 hypothetical protein CLUP02_09012 [Colletotrichum lupini]
MRVCVPLLALVTPRYVPRHLPSTSSPGSCPVFPIDFWLVGSWVLPVEAFRPKLPPHSVQHRPLDPIGPLDLPGDVWQLHLTLSVLLTTW